MLNEVSCWYVDWASIGAWVGGIGAAAAAIAAVWSVKRQERVRRDFAAFLLDRDLVRLESMHALLSGFEGHLSMFEHPIDKQREEAHRYFEEMLMRCSELLAQFEYFGHSEQQFYYRPRAEEFAELTHHASALVHIPKVMKMLLGPMKMPGAAIRHATHAAEQLKSAIDAWKVSKH